MGQSIFDKIQAKLELFRLEQRYTRRRHRRSTFVSNAVYMDGEYVYQTPNSTGSSSGSSNIDALHGGKPSASATTTSSPSTTDIDLPQSTPSPRPDQQRKRLNRFSSMPGFGGGFNNNKDMPRIEERRSSMVR
ncbi:Fc.00g013990.m01.CDS01 [Cosmosporella sp. VM-42]